MTKLTHIEVAQRLAKELAKPILYISFHENDFAELLKAAPYLNLDDDCQAISDGMAFIVCEDAEELNRLYNSTVGDDGPTELNPYDGPASVYALTIGPDGQTWNENT